MNGQAIIGDLERRVSDLYDFALDIARHDADLEFAGGSKKGVIHYVFDENIFEMFVNPWENYHFVMRDQAARPVLHGKLNAHHLTAIQSALFTAETLMSGKLPGQTKEGCYITEWHRWELLERVNVFLKTLGDGSLAGFRASISEVMRAKQKLIDDEEEVEFDLRSDPLLGLDLAELEMTFGGDDALLRQFARVRNAAAKLASDRRTEPALQLIRMLESNEAGRIKDARAIASPRVGELSKLRRVARRWQIRIREETTARAARNGTSEMKSDRSIWNDAQSLAMVEWISSQLDPTLERVVFVTGDATLFDAYRRELEQSADKRKEGTEPFILRRPLQYSTLFTNEHGRTEESRKRLFYSLQQVVELPLTTIRVAASAESKLPEEVWHRRQSLTLYRLGRNSNRSPYFHDAWVAYGSEYREDEIDKVAQQVDAHERILNGLSKDVIARRIGEADRKLHAETRHLEPAERERLFDLYINRAVDQLIRSSVDLWRPHAEASFRKALKEGPPPLRRNIPLAVHLMAPDGDGSDLARLLEAIFADRVEHGSPRVGLVLPIRTSFEIFIGGAAVALHSNEWRLGDHFCEVAINAHTYFARSEGMLPADAAEAHYLSALAKRFRLGELRIQENLHAYTAAARHFEKAVSRLKRSEDLSPSAFSSYRSLSERAAISLFYAVHCVETADKLQGIAVAREILSEGEQIFREAGDLLLEALRMELQTNFHRTAPSLGGADVERVRAQVLINITAWYALQPTILSNLSLDPYVGLVRACTANLPNLEKMIAQANNNLFSIELLAFKLISGIDTKHSAAALAKIAKDPFKAFLSLDAVVHERIVAHWTKAISDLPA